MPFNTTLAGAAVIELLRLVTNFAAEDNPMCRFGLLLADRARETVTTAVLPASGVPVPALGVWQAHRG
jgi:hypothetical protein